MPPRSFLIRGLLLAIACMLLLPTEGKAAAQTVRRTVTPRYAKAPAQSQATVCRGRVVGGPLSGADPFGYRQMRELVLPGLGTKHHEATCSTTRNAARRTTDVPRTIRGNGAGNTGKKTHVGYGALGGDMAHYLASLQEETQRQRRRDGSASSSALLGASGSEGRNPLEGGTEKREGTTVALHPRGDADGDGLTNDMEWSLGTNPLEADSDMDGVDDLTEVGDPRSPSDENGDGIHDALDPQNDFDRDGLLNRIERALGTNPLHPDTDADGVGDGLETGDPLHPQDRNRNGKTDALDPDNDSDCDGLSNSEEKLLGSRPLDPFDPGLPSPSFGCEEGAALPKTGVSSNALR